MSKSKKSWKGGVPVGLAAMLATGQATVYAARDDADILAGIPKPTARYQVNTTGPWNLTTAVYLPTFAQNDLNFVVAGPTITSVTGGLAVVKTGDRIRIRGSTSNDTSAAADGCYLVAGGNNANTITLDAATPPAANEVSAVYITIAKQALVSNNTVVDLNTSRPDKPPVEWMRDPSSTPAKLGAASDGKLLWTATAVSIHAANNDIYIVAGGKGLATVIIKGGAGEIAKYWPGYSYSFGFVGAIANLPGFRCTAVATSGVGLADLSITLNTGNLTCVSEGSDGTPVNGAINLSCNGIFGFCNAANAAGVGGYTDWRVSNIFELFGIYQERVGYIDSTAFPSIPVSTLITSTTLATITIRAARLYFDAGDVVMDGGLKSVSPSYVMLVRGGI